MKGCARTCLLWLLGWGAAAHVFFYYFHRMHDFGPPTFWASVVAGLCVVLAVAYVIGIGTAHRERKMLLDAMAGEPPEDGKWAAVSGTIRTSAPLRAPFSGHDAVAYQYKIQRYEGSDKSESQVTYYEGKALAPSTIGTRHGSIRLLAVPSFNDIEREPIRTLEAIERAKAYIRETAFETSQTPKERRMTMEKESTDDDGEFRKDKQYREAADLAENFEFEEKCIRQGEQVCAFGLYSRMRGGLIPHPNWAKETRLMRGDVTRVADRLRTRMLRYFAGVVICIAIVCAIVLLYRDKAL